jgi:hypothetical protein
LRLPGGRAFWQGCLAEHGGGVLSAFSLVKREIVPFHNFAFEHDCLSSILEG